MAIPVLGLEFNLHNSTGFSHDMEIFHVPPELVPDWQRRWRNASGTRENNCHTAAWKGEAGDDMKQNFVSAAVLQANESGALLQVL